MALLFTQLELLTCNFTTNGSIYPFDAYVIRNFSNDVILGTDVLKCFVSSINMKSFRSHLDPPEKPMPDTPQLSTISLHTSSIEHGGTSPAFYMMDQYFGNDSLEPFESKFNGSTGSRWHIYGSVGPL